MCVGVCAGSLSIFFSRTSKFEKPEAKGGLILSLDDLPFDRGQSNYDCWNYNV